MRLSDFDYELPDALIARHPPAERGASRLLDLRARALRDEQFANLPTMLASGDLLVLNDTRVLKARVFGKKPTGGRVEVVFERPAEDGSWAAMLRSSKTPAAGSILLLGEQQAQVRVLGRDGDLFRLQLEAGAEDMLALMEREGALPLPPYLSRAAEADDDARYQTVYARTAGAVAAPTAGLHFSDALLAQLQAAGVQLAYVTLHVGAGTFQPVRVDDVSEHRMHPERYWIPQATIDAIAAARARGNRVTAVGTTSLRALEAAAADAAATAASATPASATAGTPARGADVAVYASAGSAGMPRWSAAHGHHDGVAVPLASAGDTRLFITPGYPFQVVDRLITNFHLPKSTLLMLVQAFGGVALLRAAYQHAITQQYQFFSYGDAMLIDRENDARRTSLESV